LSFARFLAQHLAAARHLRPHITSDLTVCRVRLSCTLVPHPPLLGVLLPLACPLAIAPLPVGHANESVAQQLQMPSLQQGGTYRRPACKEVRGPSNLHCPHPSAAPLSSSPGRCRARARACQWNTPTLGSEPRPPPTTACHAESCSLAVGPLTDLFVRSRTPNDMSLSRAAGRGLPPHQGSSPRCTTQRTDGVD
jgi:hypothetical protein